jgi:hypothetical protein
MSLKSVVGNPVLGVRWQPWEADLAGGHLDGDPRQQLMQLLQ